MALIALRAIFIMGNSVKLSNGGYVSKAKADRKISKAKEEFKQKFYDEHGYFFCERLLGNKYKNPGIAVSHIVSVNECQNMGMAELAWSFKNMEMLSQKAHSDWESKSHHYRFAWYMAKKEGISFKDFEKDYI